MVAIYSANLAIKLALIKRNVKAQANWDSTVGTIFDININNWSDLEDGTEYFDIRPNYLYYVDNTKYRGNKISACIDREVFFSLESVKRYTSNNHLNRDERITVYYDPENPVNSVLKMGTNNDYIKCKSDYLIRIGLGCFFTLVFFIVWSVAL